MASLIALILITRFFTSVSGKVSFINPAPFGKRGDFSNSDTYRQGSLVNIAWTPADEGNGVSVVLWQLNRTTGAWYGDMEYLTQGAVDVVRYSWLVGTRKNLSESNLFYLSLFQEGNGPSDANSHYFYIKKDVSAEPTSAASPTSSTGISIATNRSPSSTLRSDPSSGPTAGSSPNLQGSPSSTVTNSFPMTAKIGIGIGIPAAILFGLAAGFLLFRHRKKKDNPYEMETPLVRNQCYNNGGYHGPNHNEARAKPPKEMAPVYLQPASANRHDRARGRRETVRYEM